MSHFGTVAGKSGRQESAAPNPFDRASECHVNISAADVTTQTFQSELKVEERHVPGGRREDRQKE